MAFISNGRMLKLSLAFANFIVYLSHHDVSIAVDTA